MTILGEKSRGQINYDILDEGPAGRLQQGLGRLFRNRRFQVTFVVLLALVLRLWAGLGLSLDFDEPVYLTAAGDYAQLVQQGDWRGLIDYEQNQEHPPLTKIIYALVILALGPKQEWWIVLTAARFVSAVFGTLAVLLLALLDPLAGLFLALQTLVVKYTSQTYLEALPLFATMLSVYALLRTRTSAGKHPNAWFWLSAASLGWIAAGKYSYFPVVFVLLYIAIWEKRIRWPYLLGYLGLAGAVFWVFDPHLWRDPIQRFVSSISFHGDYSQSQHVQQAGYPWYQPFLWISRSWGARWHPEVFFNLGLDTVIFILGILGLRKEWQERRWVLVWLVAGMAALLLWPTRWPQYTLIVLPAVCLAAASGARGVARWLHEKESYWGWVRALLPNPTTATLVAAILFIGIAVVSVLSNAVVVSINRLGWSQVNTITTPLPGNTVNQVLALQDGRMAMATNRGAAIWQTGGAEADTWEIFTRENSDLPDDEVLSAAQDAQGRLWFGTRNGLAMLEGDRWRTFAAQEIGLAGDDIFALEPDQAGGMWAGTEAGAAYFDGRRWSVYTSAETGLLDDLVLSLAVQPGGAVWLGTRLGISRFQPETGAWQAYSVQNAGLGSGGVADLMIDSQGRLWASLLGGGISIFDGAAWRHYRTVNSDLPTNLVKEVFETAPGEYWVSTGVPNSPGGFLSLYNETTKEWKVFRPGRTGYSGAEVVSIAREPSGQMWFGTLTSGIDRYLPRDATP
jgi:sugar lactone lactonase YvrE